MVRMEKVTLPVERLIAVFTRNLPGVGLQPLVCTEQGLHPLLGLDEASAHQRLSGCIRLGPPLPITERTLDGRIVPYTWSPGLGSDVSSRAPRYAVADAGEVGDGGLCFLATRDSLLRLDASGLVELVAGQPGCPGRRDGAGAAAQVQSALVMAPDGTGGLFFSDGSRDCVRRARLAAAPRPPPALAVSVATLPFHIPDWSLVHAMAYDYTAAVLYVCTPRMIYRVVGVGAAAGSAAPALQPVAGAEEDGSGGGGGGVDGVGPAARFGSICDAVVDSRGCLYVTDMEGPDGDAVVRCADPTTGWAVQTLPSASLGQPDRAARLTVLPGGWLCVYEWGGNNMWLLNLGLEPSRPPSSSSAAAPPMLPTAAPSAPAPPCTTGDSDLAALAEDFGALLADLQHTADVTVMVGGGPFPAHSQVLLARSGYFRRLLLQGGGVSTEAAAGGRRELPLPDADPEAFARVLRYIYTGSTDFSEPLLRPVLELANRLLLPRLVSRVEQRLQQHHQHFPPSPPASGAPPAGPAAVNDLAGGPAPPGSGAALAPGGPPAGCPAAPSGPPAPAPAAAPTPLAVPPASGQPYLQDDSAPSAPPASPWQLQASMPPPQQQPQQPQQPQPQLPQLPQPPPGLHTPQPPRPQLQTLQPPVLPQLPQAQPYPPYSYSPRPALEPMAAPPPPAFGPPPPAFGAPAPAAGYAAGPAQMYGGAPPGSSSSFGAPPSSSTSFGAPPRPGYGTVSAPAHGAAPGPPSYVAPGPAYQQAPAPGMYGAATPLPAGYIVPPPYPPQGYPPQGFGVPSLPPQSSSFFHPPR